jgi:uncharacterized protein (DUF2141 family)
MAISNLFVLIFLSILNLKPTISVKIIGLEHNRGKVFLLLLDENEREVGKKIVAIADKTATAEFSVPNAGRYAVKVFHDENSNQKLDTNLVGLPKEKWGVSNNVKAKLGPPDFKKMLFEVHENTSIAINLQ